MESDQIDILAFTVHGNLEQVDETQEPRLARQLRGDVRKANGRDRVHFDLTFVHAVAGAAIGRQLPFETISEEEVHRGMKAWGEPAEVVTAHLSIYRAIREERLATVTDNVERVLGRKLLTFDQWVKENAAGIPVMSQQFWAHCKSWNPAK